MRTLNEMELQCKCLTCLMTPWIQIGHQLRQTRTRKMTVWNCKLKAIVSMEGKITGHRASTKNVYLTSQISTLAVCHLYRRVRLARNNTEQFHKRSHVSHRPIAL